MNKQDLRATTIGVIASIVLTINPVSQILLLTLNGGLAYIFALPFDASTRSGVVEKSALILNSILIVLGSILFYISFKVWKTILSSFLIMFSGQALMLFISDEFNGGDNYFLGWLTVSGIPTLTLLTFAILKYYPKMTFRKGNI